MTHRSIPSRTLPERPNLAQLKRQAKELLDAFRQRDGLATTEVRRHYRRADPDKFALHDAQLVLARAYGFESWPKLKAFVDGVTVRQLVDAIAVGNLARVRSMVEARPELVHLDVAEDDEHRALHHAVLCHQPAIVRFLMERGADARKGIWPHRSATTAYTLAVERGDSEIAAIIEAEERRRPASEPLAPMDEADTEPSATTAGAAIASGDAGWLRARHAQGLIAEGQALVSHAVVVGRTDMLRLLLELGLDPDEPSRVQELEEVVASWGAPLRACALSGDVATAAILLEHGANPDTNVYAATSALYEAYARHDHALITLIERHGGRLNAVAVGALGLVEQAARWLADASPSRNAEPSWDGAAIARDLLWGAIESPAPEIIGVVLSHVDWPRDDRRWYGILENGLYLDQASDRPRCLQAFRLVLDRSDPDVRSPRGTTLLHEIAASRGGLTATDRLAYAGLMLERGARLDLRDDLLRSTALSWACRWGRLELVELLLAHGADPVEAAADAWASPLAWATKRGHHDVAAVLERAMGRE